MSRLRPEKLHVNFAAGVTPTELTVPRRYTLTHSDTTGELFLTIGAAYDKAQISGWYTRLMRDEVLAEWREEGEVLSLHVFCHVSGGMAFGPAGWRYAIFQHEIPLVLESFRHGDRRLFETLPGLDQAPVVVHFASGRRRYRRTERWGTMADYRL